MLSNSLIVIKESELEALVEHALCQYYRQYTFNETIISTLSDIIIRKTTGVRFSVIPEHTSKYDSIQQILKQ